MTKDQFILTKWYVDVIDANGCGMVGYKALLQWRKVTLGYEGLIPLGLSSLNAESNFMLKGAPLVDANCLYWESERCSGVWTGSALAQSRNLLESKTGLVNWHCLQPRSDVKVMVLDQKLEGFGYAEKMEMTIPPWRLPIRELYWGRYVSELHNLTWIRWEGPRPKLLILFNGSEERGSVNERAVEFNGMDVILPQQTFRSGTIGESVFSGFSKIASLFPKSILDLHEQKWAGKAHLRKAGLVVDSGNVIHEKVLWS